MNPSGDQKKLAEKRAATCDSCRYKSHNTQLDFFYCGKCGCPIQAKIFSPLPGKEACPEGVWEV